MLLKLIEIFFYSQSCIVFCVPVSHANNQNTKCIHIQLSRYNFYPSKSSAECFATPGSAVSHLFILYLGICRDNWLRFRKFNSAAGFLHRNTELGEQVANNIALKAKIAQINITLVLNDISSISLPIYLFTQCIKELFLKNPPQVNVKAI